MNSNPTIICAAGIALLAAFPSASFGATTIIGVELGNGETLEASDSAGVIATSNWLQRSGSPGFTNLTINYSDGAAVSGATVSGSGFGSNLTTSVAVSALDANTEMFNRGVAMRLQGDAQTATISFAGLPTTGDWAAGYSVYVYFAPNSAGSGTRDFSLTLGSTTYHGRVTAGTSNYTGTFSQLTSTDALNPGGGNYAVFSSVSGSSFSLSGVVKTNGADVAITGVQIVATAVPEPSSFALLAGFGAVGFAVARRRPRA